MTRKINFCDFLPQNSQTNRAGCVAYTRQKHKTQPREDAQYSTDRGRCSSLASALFHPNLRAALTLSRGNEKTAFTIHVLIVHQAKEMSAVPYLLTVHMAKTTTTLTSTTHLERHDPTPASLHHVPAHSLHIPHRDV